MTYHFSLIIYKDDNFSEFYTITDENSGDKIWLQNQDGEGGTFNPSDLYEAIDKFFKENY